MSYIFLLSLVVQAGDDQPAGGGPAGARGLRRGARRPLRDGPARPQGMVGKNSVFFYKKKPQPSGFFCFFKNIFAQKREFLGFFQFQEYF